MAWVYLTLEKAIEIHQKTVDVSGGGSPGHLDIGKLDSALQHIQNDDYYPTFDTKLTHLFFGACKLLQITLPQKNLWAGISDKSS